MPIRRHDVHVCLVSEEATPNFIPVLDTRFRPREVILVVSPQMRERARWLKEALAHRVERVIADCRRRIVFSRALMKKGLPRSSGSDRLLQSPGYPAR